jgi:exopolyphosphatase / guanosine-5'-triphosphate,3'-diphosphate pyrophosphatase
MRIAVIDMGTNTFNLVIADQNQSHYTILHHDKFVVKLGEGGINLNIIRPEPFWRAVDYIEKILEVVKAFEVTEIFAFATSAIREASNGKLFVDTIDKLFGLKVEVISGDREAALIYSGVKSAVTLSNKKSLIMDIGGGSTEFIIGNNDEIFWKSSYKLGAARLLELFNPPEPMSKECLTAIETYLNKELSSLDEVLKEHEIEELIGSSGSFDTFAEMICHSHYFPEMLVGKTTFDFNLTYLVSLHHRLLNSTRTQRLEMPGMIAMRVDMIVIASVFVQYILNKYGISKVRLSTYSLKEGVLYQMIRK